ncbi:STN domain-containing protein [Planctomicrobium sp.]|nr:STN domain-containing protein [bacterium]MDB4743353.1 STN domain-containing protein [Planctomicrobium sp.]
MSVVGADEREDETFPIVSMDEPFLPASLTQRATVEFESATLADFKVWFEKTTDLELQFDDGYSDEDKIQRDQAFEERLLDQPIYLLLGRLGREGLQWRLEGNKVVVSKYSNSPDVSKIYLIDDLLDAGYSQEVIMKMVTTQTSGPWYIIDQDGGFAEMLENVLLVHQPFEVHREVHNILINMNESSKEIRVGETAERLRIREALQEDYSFSFKKRSLTEIIKEISKQTNLDIRISPDLQDVGYYDPDTMIISLKVKELSLEMVLRELLEPHNISYEEDNGIIWVGSWVGCPSLSTVIYDVDDICRDKIEADDLGKFLQKVTTGPWQEIDFDGGDIYFPRPRTMVIRQSKEVHQEIRDALKSFRTVRNSSSELPSNEVVTRFYKLDTKFAEALKPILWELIPESKESIYDETPPGLGKISLIPSSPIYYDPQGNELAEDATPDDHARIAEQTTMVVTHRKRIHRHIEKLIERINAGDPPITPKDVPEEDPWGIGGFGGGGGFF